MLIELDHITFSYTKEEPPVLEDFSLRIPKGSCLIIRGENGSGKTTLFRILNGLSFPESGSYRFNETEITKAYLKKNENAKRFHKQIGYLFQNPDLMLFNATVYDEIAFGPRQMGLDETEVERRALDCMDLFRIRELAEKAPYHLSGGQKKRVAFAAVMALNPDVLVLDEPFAGLDRKTQDWMKSFFLSLKENKKTLLIATHESELPADLPDQVIDLSAETSSDAPLT